jgi:hypothetical protein
MVATALRRGSNRYRAPPFVAAAVAALLAACAATPQLGGPAELIGSWRLSGASEPIPAGCEDTTLTFQPDGTFAGRSGTLVTRGRYFTTAHEHSYRLRLERREFIGAENCQGITARTMAARSVSDVDLKFERERRDFRLTAPIARGAYILYTRAD